MAAQLYLGSAGVCVSSHGVHAAYVRTRVLWRAREDVACRSGRGGGEVCARRCAQVTHRHTCIRRVFVDGEFSVPSNARSDAYIRVR